MPDPSMLQVPPDMRDALTYSIHEFGLTVPLWLLGAAVITILLFIWFLKRLTRPRYYFFVRHGQTANNAARVRQGADGGLSDSGIEQAERTAAFLRPFQIRQIYASPYERTRQTAEIIAQELHCRIRYNSLLVERRNPSEVIGKSTDDPSIKQIGDQIDLTFHDDDFRFSDEENFIDLKKRARKALRFLARRHASRICVVTHGIFLKMMMAYLLYREDLHAHDWVKVSFFSPADNAGMTLCVYRPLLRFNKTRGWEVLSYNVTIPTAFSPASGSGIVHFNELLPH